MEISYQLKFFIAGNTPKSKLALNNLTEFCEEHLKGRYVLEIIDLILRPDQAELHSIFAIPTLVKTDPEPMKRLIGLLSDKAKMLSVLNIATS